jgi:hypothetical protein
MQKEVYIAFIDIPYDPYHEHSERYDFLARNETDADSKARGRGHAVKKSKGLCGAVKILHLETLDEFRARAREMCDSPDSNESQTGCFMMSYASQLDRKYNSE